jgi:hypothetical protein
LNQLESSQISVDQSEQSTSTDMENKSDWLDLGSCPNCGENYNGCVCEEDMLCNKHYVKGEAVIV